MTDDPLGPFLLTLLDLYLATQNPSERFRHGELPLLPLRSSQVGEASERAAERGYHLTASPWEGHDGWVLAYVTRPS